MTSTISLLNPDPEHGKELYRTHSVCVYSTDRPKQIKPNSLCKMTINGHSTIVCVRAAGSKKGRLIAPDSVLNALCISETKQKAGNSFSVAFTEATSEEKIEWLENTSDPLSNALASVLAQDLEDAKSLKDQSTAILNQAELLSQNMDNSRLTSERSLKLGIMTGSFGFIWGTFVDSDRVESIIGQPVSDTAFLVCLLAALVVMGLFVLNPWQLLNGRKRVVEKL